MILADNGSPWYISGAPDRHWNNDALHQLDRLTGRDFEVVDTRLAPAPRPVEIASPAGGEFHAGRGSVSRGAQRHPADRERPRAVAVRRRAPVRAVGARTGAAAADREGRRRTSGRAERRRVPRRADGVRRLPGDIPEHPARPRRDRQQAARADDRLGPLRPRGRRSVVVAGGAQRRVRTDARGPRRAAAALPGRRDRRPPGPGGTAGGEARRGRPRRAAAASPPRPAAGRPGGGGGSRSSWS